MAAVNSAIESELRQAAIRLAGKGFLGIGDVVSQRIPERDAFVELTIGMPDMAMARWTNLSDAPLGLHHRIYAARPDVGAIAAGGLPWTGALSRLDLSIPAVFDEQVRHLGLEVVRVSMRMADPVPLDILANGANAYALDDASLCFGMGLERLTANIEILEKCAESFVLARAASAEVRRIPWLIRFIANRRLRKDQKEAAGRHLGGLRAVTKAGY
jgi:hypothetical protein